MAQTPDQITRDIQMTRAELARDVDMLADRALPSRVVKRRWNSVRDKLRGVSDRVMGAPKDLTHTAGEKMHSAMEGAEHMAQETGEKVREVASRAVETVEQAPKMIRRQTQGNPLAAGMIAFGTGLLAASLLPETRVEKQAARQLQQHAGELLDQVREPLMRSAQEVKQEMSGSVSEATERVKETAREAVQATTHEAKDAARQMGR